MRLPDRWHFVDILVVLICPLLATCVAFALGVNAFDSILLYFGLPVLYLSVRAIRYVKKAAVFSSLTSVPAIIVIDYVAHLNGQWLIPSSVLPFRMLGFVTIEVVLWAFLNVYFVIFFYEFFLNRGAAGPLWNNRARLLFIFLAGVVVVFALLVLFCPIALQIPYFYFLFGTSVIVFPSLIGLHMNPNKIGKFVVVGAYFFFLSFLYEITALHLDWWRFPSDEYVGVVSLLGVSFPLEEWVFWFTLFSTAILTFYEHFAGVEGTRLTGATT